MKIYRNNYLSGNLLMRLSILGFVCLIATSCARHYVMEVPREPEQEKAMKPYDNAVWIDGEWEWHKNHHEFVKGYYNPSRHGSSYMPGEWKHSAKGYYYRHGHWRKSST
jgi:hypothetical protein